MKSVALVGFSDKTFHFCKESKADEMWSLNHAYLAIGLPRLDRLFEIHKRDWYLRKEVEKSARYADWLAQTHPFPIYMQAAEVANVPSAVAYPLQDIVNTLLPGLVEQHGDEYVVREYFTSSFAYMMAMAIYEQYSVIEIYGIDMENDTEYGYQRPCGEFWIGLAVGRGIKVVFQQPCTLCNAPLYGYEEVPYIDAHRVKELMMLYQEWGEKYTQEMQALAQELAKDPSNKDYVDRYLITSAWSYTHQGAVQACERLILESDSYISLQFLELKRAAFINGMDYWKGMTNTTKSTHKASGTEEDWLAYLSARASMFANMGAIQVYRRLMDVINFRPVTYELVMEITE